MKRLDFFQFTNGDKVPLPFSDKEYENRLKGLRKIIEENNLDAVILTSLQNIAYYSGFLYCSFGRQYACVVTPKRNVVISGQIDAGQPARRCYGENLIYTDWKKDNYFKAIIHVLGKVKKIGVEEDHLTTERYKKLQDSFDNSKIIDISPLTMSQRMIKSDEEIALIRSGAKIADIGGEALRKAIKIGASEIDVAMVGRDAMEKAIA